MALQQTLVEYMRDAASPANARQFSNALMSQSAGGMIQEREAGMFSATVGALGGRRKKTCFFTADRE
jgi:hypothetical protein